MKYSTYIKQVHHHAERCGCNLKRNYGYLEDFAKMETFRSICSVLNIIQSSEFLAIVHASASVHEFLAVPQEFVEKCDCKSIYDIKKRYEESINHGNKAL